MKIIKAIAKVILSLLGIGTAMVVLAGCATKTRSVELSGLYANESGTLAIGSVDVMAAPIGEESAFIKYDEDNAWLSPSMKLHDIKIMLTGTNSTEQASALVKHICEAFIAVKPGADIGIDKGKENE